MCRCGCRFCYCCGQKGACGGGPFYNNFADYEEDEEFDWDPDTESVAGDVRPLFQSLLGEYWWDVWFPPTVEYEDYDISPMFSSHWYEYEEDENEIDGSDEESLE